MRWWWMGGALVAMGLVLALVWTIRPARPPAAAIASPLTSADRPVQSEAQAQAARDSLAQAAAAAEARLQASVERLAQQDREREEAHRLEREATEKRMQAEQARRRELAQAVRARADAAAEVSLPVPPAPEPAPAPLPAPPEQNTRPMAPTPVASVDQRCAASTNFINRAICQSQACEDPALTQDPVCRRLRRIEQMNQRDPNLAN